ncbi:MAG: molybdopterin converting factor subunit 1 [Thermomicrobiales bacterium]
MQIVVKYFAMVRERLGISEESLELEAGSTVGAVYEHVAGKVPELQPLLDRSMIMRNHEYVDLSDQLHEGDEIAVIPPVSGGDHFRVHEGVLDQQAIAGRVENTGAGAVVVFTGVVRDNARGRSVQALEYEAYPAAAERQLARVATEMRERWEILAVAMEHRFGLLEIGEASVVIAVSSAHRDAAFEATSFAISRIKEIVPIWKKEFYEDGDTWVGSESEYQDLIASERGR